MSLASHQSFPLTVTAGYSPSAVSPASPTFSQGNPPDLDSFYSSIFPSSTIEQSRHAFSSAHSVHTTDTASFSPLIFTETNVPSPPLSVYDSDTALRNSPVSPIPFRGRTSPGPTSPDDPSVDFSSYPSSDPSVPQPKYTASETSSSGSTGSSSVYSFEKGVQDVLDTRVSRRFNFDKGVDDVLDRDPTKYCTSDASLSVSQTASGEIASTTAMWAPVSQANDQSHHPYGPEDYWQFKPHNRRFQPKDPESYMEFNPNAPSSLSFEGTTDYTVTSRDTETER